LVIYSAREVALGCGLFFARPPLAVGHVAAVGGISRGKRPRKRVSRAASKSVCIRRSDDKPFVMRIGHLVHAKYLFDPGVVLGRTKKIKSRGPGTHGSGCEYRCSDGDHQ
jgi:hypothetical protein